MSQEALPLSAREQEVVAFLREQWGHSYRITTIEQGMAALGMPLDHRVRLKIGRYLAQDLSLSDKLKRWSPVPFILTEGEKLVARCIWNAWRQSGRVVPIGDLGRALALPQRIIESGLSVLEELGFLHFHGDAYHPVEDFEERAGGLGFNFHTVTVKHGERFNVP